MLVLLWRMGYMSHKSFFADDSRVVEIVSEGEYDEAEGMQHGAEVVIDGIRSLGKVCFGSKSEVDDSTVLRVVECRCPISLNSRQQLVAQITVPIPESVSERYSALADAKSSPCGDMIAAMDSLHRTDLFTKLLVERLQRKCGDVMRIYTDCGKDWNQTLYTLLFRAMGDNRNGAAFAELATRIPYFVLSREKDNPRNIEALLFGAAGLLDRYPSDEHIRLLKEDFNYLARKYSVQPMHGGSWTLSGINPNNQPSVRLAELAGYLQRSEFLFNKLIVCRTSTDLETLFGNGLTDVSEYWQNHFVPSSFAPRRAKRVGRGKINLLGINFVVPLQFAYADMTDNEDLKSSALTLLESLKAEDNSIVRRWTLHGVRPTSAFDTQALLQLTNEYCAKRGCALCRVGRNEIKKCL